MRMAAAMVIVFTIGCSPRAYHRANIATLAIAEATLACDWNQTMGAEQTGWRWNYEANPMLGPAPSGGAVTAYFAAVGVGLLAASQLLPPKISPFVLGAVAAVELKTIGDNAFQPKMATRLCRY